MALTKEDLQAISDLMDSKLEPIKADIAQIKEDTGVTRETTNMLGEWVEVASDVLKVEYPVRK